MPCVDNVPWSGIDSATERGERTKLPRRRGEGCRVSENGEGGDSWVRRLSLLKVVRGFEKMTRTREDPRHASD